MAKGKWQGEESGLDGFVGGPGQQGNRYGAYGPAADINSQIFDKISIGPLKRRSTLRGYVYIMRNPSMPGLVKIGRTERSPSDRQSELSQPTGVPTPFELVYFEAFIDAMVAEKWIHDRFASAGMRVSDSREFFQVDLPAAIRALVEAPGKIQDIYGLANFDEEQPMESQEQDAKCSPSVGQAIYHEALASLFGIGDKLEDGVAAMRNFETASNLGIAEADLWIGILLRDGIGRPRNEEAAFSQLKKAASKGVIWAHFELWWHFYRSGNDSNAYKCLSKFSELIDAGEPQGTYLDDIAEFDAATSTSTAVAEFLLIHLLLSPQQFLMRVRIFWQIKSCIILGVSFPEDYVSIRELCDADADFAIEIILTVLKEPAPNTSRSWFALWKFYTKMHNRDAAKYCLENLLGYEDSSSKSTPVDEEVIRFCCYYLMHCFKVDDVDIDSIAIMFIDQHRERVVQEAEKMYIQTTSEAAKAALFTVLRYLYSRSGQAMRMELIVASKPRLP